MPSVFVKGVEVVVNVSKRVDDAGVMFTSDCECYARSRVVVAKA